MTPHDNLDLSADDWDEANFPRPEENDFDRVVERAISRRGFLGGILAFGSGASVMGTGLLNSASAQAQAASRFAFTPIAAQTDFDVHVPQGYSWHTLVRWGDPLMPQAEGYDLTEGGPVQGSDMVFGENTDGMETFLFRGHQLIAVNHEYTNRKVNLPAAQEGVVANADDVRKLQNLQGVTVMEIRESDSGWEVVTDSRFNRRITHRTPMTIAGPAAGHDLMKTEADPTGTASLGTLNNCGSGKTPWGTYLTCEENFNGYFGSTEEVQDQKPNALVAYQHAAALYPALDGVLFAGDLVQHPRRASDWVSGHVAGAQAADPRPAFFDALQGRYHDVRPDAPFAGGALLQSAPLYPAVGNHEVSGRFRLNAPVPGTDRTVSIAAMYNDPQPRWFAARTHGPDAVPDASHDFDTYRALFRQPASGDPAEGYYATRIGDVFLVSLNVSRIWRRPIAGHPQQSGKYDEGQAVLHDPDRWGLGEFLFTRIDADAPQVAWLRDVLDSPDARGATYRVAMLHQSAFGLGANSVPVLADPVWTLDATTPDGGHVQKRLTFPPDPAARRALFDAEVAPLIGRLTALRYDYPRDADLFATVLDPILQAGAVDLVMTGHSHIWNRFRSGDMHLLETSNAGNCYGAFWIGPDGQPWQGRLRDDAPRHQGFWSEVAAGLRDPDDYPRTGDPRGRVPVMPTGFNPMFEHGESTVPVPFVCSNRLSVFSVLDSAAGVVRSYVIDTADPDAKAREFDQFVLGRP